MTSAENPVLRWRTPPLARGSAATTANLSDSQQMELEQLRQQAREEGMQAGREEALESHRAWIEERLDHLSQLLLAINKPYEDINEQVAEELARLAGKIARQLLRRELKTSPDAIMGVVREAIACLPEEREEIKVYLNHEDAELVREMSQSVDQDRNWELLRDPTIERGDCMVTMGASSVDASLDARVNAIVAQLLGGEREQDVES